MSFGSSPSAPSAPDPTATANAQTASNQQTALYNYGLSNPNVVTPLGSQTYSIGNTTPTYDYDAYNKAVAAYNAQPASTGGSTWTPGQPLNAQIAGGVGGSGTTAPKGAAPTLSQFQTSAAGNPQVTETQSLSPIEQQLFDSQNQQSLGLSNLATQLQSGVGTALNQPIPSSGDLNTANQQARDAYYNQETQTLDPQFAQEQQALTSSLANQGIPINSDAYKTAMGNFNLSKNQAYQSARDSSIDNGVQNAQQLFSLSSAARELPLNEFNALRSQSQVSMPQFSAAQNIGAQPTNVAGIDNSAYQGQLGVYNAQQQAANNATTGLFGLGGSIGSAFAGSDAGSALINKGITAAIGMSDIRLKDNIEHIGEENGHKIYHFRYKGFDTVFRGVMAQDILETNPDAVIKFPNGYMAVDYSKLGIEFRAA